MTDTDEARLRAIVGEEFERLFVRHFKEAERDGMTVAEAREAAKADPKGFTERWRNGEIKLAKEPS